MGKSNPETWIKRVTAAVGSGGWGLGAALIASLCCAPPAMAFVLGLGGSAFLVGPAQYKPFFGLAGMAVMVPVGWRLLKPVGRCGVRERRARIARLTLLVAIFVGGYVAINYLLLPWLYALG